MLWEIYIRYDGKIAQITPLIYMYQSSDDGNDLSSLKDAKEDKRPQAKCGAEGLLGEGET